MYRALTWEAIRLNIDLEDEEALCRLAQSTTIEISSTGDSSALVNGQDITPELQGAAVETGVSLVSKVGGVREVLVREQQILAQGGKIVMAGRDIGTTVLPRAELKVYLGASAEERARRRCRELVERGEEADYQAILADLIRRDEIDSKRAISPLQPASDARLIDTDGLSPEQVLAEIFGLIGES